MSECNCKNILNLQPQCPVTLNVQPQCNPVVNMEPQSGKTIIMDTAYHNQLLNRDMANQHPISAITNLQNSLDTLQENITQEETERKAADETLADGITALTTAVTTAITNEATARNNADTQIVNTLNYHINNKSNPHRVNKVQVGLGNVDNTSDMDKPISTATQSALNGMVTIATGQTISGAKTFSNTVTMAGQTQIAASHNYNSYAVFQRLPSTGEQIFSNAGDKLRLRGSETRPQYNGNDLALYSDVTAEGEDLTAHINNKNNPHEVTKAQVGLGNVSNLAPADLPISTATQNALDVVSNDIDDIKELIPNQATASNQLADKSFVNSSIATNTANFIGTFNSVAELEAYSGTLTNNDYAFVVGTDSVGNTVYDRYKYTDATTPASWIFEYVLNNSSFTDGQWKAINSGATSDLVEQITTNQENITTIQTTMDGYGNIVTHNVSEFATAAQGAKADTAVQPADLAAVATSGSYDDLDDKPTIGNATLTIQKNGTAVDTFTANATANKAINITVPTDTSDLTNGAGYQTASDVATAIAGKQDTLVSGTNIKTINNTSILGSGDITLTASSVGALPNSTKYGADLSYSSNTLQLKDQDGNNLGNSVTIQASADLDETTISKNSSGELQAIGLINKNPSGSTIYDWVGTLAEYEAQNIETLHPDWTCYITDDLSPNIYPMRNIGEIIQSTVPLTDAGVHLLDGSLISGSGAYADFVTYIAGLVGTYPDLFETEANWQQSVTDYGVCGKFVYDSVNSTVRLPKITGFTEGTITATSLGDLTQAGLPNITGSSTSPYQISAGNGTQSSGAISAPNAGTSGGYYGTAYAGADWGNGFSIDASLSSSIYGNSSTVQPQSIKVLYYIVIATSTKTQIEVDIDEIATDLNGKADVDLSNCTVLEPCHVVIETYINGTSWYRVYDDGWCEQGGYVPNLPSDSYASVTFIKEFGNTNYFFHNQIECNRAIGTGWDGGSADEVYTSRTTTGTEVTGDGISNSKKHYGFFWEAKGYIN